MDGKNIAYLCVSAGVSREREKGEQGIDQVRGDLRHWRCTVIRSPTAVCFIHVRQAGRGGRCEADKGPDENGEWR